MAHKCICVPRNFAKFYASRRIKTQLLIQGIIPFLIISVLSIGIVRWRLDILNDLIIEN